jgi:hypothetical protein
MPEINPASSTAALKFNQKKYANGDRLPACLRDGIA